jgi:dihydrofolate reductase
VKPRLSLIVAMTRDGLMGRGKSLPWRWPEDLAHFKRLTKGHVCIMGRLTFESLCEQFGGPLKQRENVVVSREAKGGNQGELRDGGRWFASLEAALAWAGPVETQRAEAAGLAPEVFLLGGAQLFRSALTTLRPAPDALVVTWVPDVPIQPGDTVFPFRPPEEWLLREHRAARRWTSADGQLEFVVYERAR